MKKIQSSPMLHKFYVEYLAWVEAGAEGSTFTKKFGLCTNLFDYVADLHSGRMTEGIQVQEELHKCFDEAGLYALLPFNPNGWHYTGEKTNSTCHLNEQRIAWVRARIKDGIKGD